MWGLVLLNYILLSESYRRAGKGQEALQIIDKALEKGLGFRSLGDTINDTLAWRKTMSDEMKAGISAERESELLRKWREQK